MIRYFNTKFFLRWTIIMSSIDISAYEPIFYPESIAIIGASDSTMKFGGMMLRVTKSYGFKGEIYPVNPKGGEIQGLTGYKNINDIAGPVDFAVIAVPSKFVLEAVKDCVKKGVAGAEILAAGFKEAGDPGVKLEEEVARVAREGNLRLIGPNGFGLYSPASGMTLLPGTAFPKKPGPVGIISQSGGGACDIVYMSKGRSVGFSVVVSIGNGIDIDAAEMLRYFEADERTKIVGAYIEGVNDGRDFFDALKSCARKKPVVVLKGGLSEQGHRGTLGHTGSMAGSKEAWNAAVKSAGAVLARDSRDMAELLMAFNCLEGFKGGGAGILAGGGMRCVDGLDAASEYGFPVPELDDESAKIIQSMLPAVGARGANPVDLANPVMSPAIINEIMDILADREDVDFLIIYQMLFYLLIELRNLRQTTGDPSIVMEFHTELTKKALEIRENTGKPLVMILLDIASDPDDIDIEEGRWQARSYYTKNKIPCFDTGLQAFSVLRRVSDFYKMK
jgi:acetate---CoA ligase (ADP-forming) subunit alpha